jgi:hypothetical protein
MYQPKRGRNVSRFRGPQSSTKAATILLPCSYRGKPVRGLAAPDLVRDWVACDHPKQPLGPVVCSCYGCGPRCPGYPSDDA